MKDIEGDVYLGAPMSGDMLEGLQRCGADLLFSGESICVDLGDEQGWRYIEAATALQSLRRELGSQTPGIGFCFLSFQNRIINCALNEPLRCHYWTAATRPFSENEAEHADVHQRLLALFRCCGLDVLNR